jgi:TP901 family phage tail tape measure protein
LAGIQAGTAYVPIRGDFDALDKDLKGAEKSFGEKFAGFGKKAAMAFSGAVVAGAVASVTAFAGFERQMNEVFTLMPGISEKSMGKMTDQVKSFAKEFGVLPDKVVPALYQALSAGVPPDNVFDFLETAQKAAKGGVTDLTTAVDGISSVVNAYGAETMSATEASDLMFTAVRLGKTNFEELSQSLFNVTPTASALGVEFGDVTAALAAMTAQGVPTSVATTQLRQLFVELSKEGGKTSDVFKEIAGKPFKQFVAEGGNVQDALQLLEKHAADSGVGINDLFGSVEAGGAALALTGGGTEAFSSALSEMGSSAGATEKAFEQMDKGIGPMWDKLKAQVAVLAIEVGEKLVPVLLAIGEWAAKNKPVIAAIAVVVGTFLVAAMVAWAVSAAMAAAATIAAAAPVIALGVAIAALIAGAFYVWTHWEEIWTKIKDFVGDVLDAVVGFVKDLAGRAKDALVGAWQAFARQWETVWLAVKTFVSDRITEVVDFVKALPGRLLEVFRAAWGLYWDYYVGAWRAVVSFVWDRLVDVVGFIRELPGRLLEALTSTWQTFWGYWVGLVASIRQAVWDALLEVVGFFMALPGRLVEAVTLGFEILVDLGKKIVNRVWDGIKVIVQGAGGLGEWFTGLPGRIGQWVREGAQKLFDVGVMIVKTIVDGIKSIAGSIGSAILDAIPGGGIIAGAIGKIPGIGDGPGRSVGGSALSRVQSALISGTYVTSTYRTPEQNRRVGGSPTSYHMDRNNPAVDIGGSYAALNQLAGKLRMMGGWREFLWKVPGHYDHIHVAHQGGRVTPSGIEPLRSDELLAKLQMDETILPAGSGGFPDPEAWARRAADELARHGLLLARTH